MKKLIIAWLVAGTLATLALGEKADLQSPVVAAGGGYRIQRPEMYHRGWVDLNRNGLQDAYEDPAQPVEARVEDLLKRMTRAGAPRSACAASK